MTRPTILAVAATLALLAGCGGSGDAPSNAVASDQAAMADNAIVEDVSADGLAAPSDMPMDSESNGVGSASGGNAM